MSWCDLVAFEYFSLIAFMLGWVLSIFMFWSPMFFATLTKKLLKTSHISSWFVMILLFSWSVTSFWLEHPLLVRKGFTVSQKSFDFGPPGASFNKIIIYRLLLQFCYIIPMFTISLPIFSRVYILEFVIVHSLFINCRSQSFIHIWNLFGFNFPFFERVMFICHFQKKCC